MPSKREIADRELIARCRQLPRPILQIIQKFALAPSAVRMLNRRAYKIHEFMKYHAGSPLMEYVIRRRRDPIMIYEAAYSLSFIGFYNTVHYFKHNKRLRRENRKGTSDHWPINCAAEVGNIETIRWLRAHGRAWDSDTSTDAAVYGQIGAVKWLHENGCPWNARTSMWIAIRCSPNEDPIFKIPVRLSFDDLKWAIINGCPYNESTFAIIAERGNLDELKWLLGHKQSLGDDPRLLLSSSTLERAVKHGNLDNVKWLHMHGCELTAKVFTAAMKSRGNVCKLIGWLYGQKCPWNALTFEAAAKYTTLKIIIWLYDRDCPWDVETFVGAATRNNFRTMKWLQRHGCPWRSRHAFAAVAKHGNLKAMIWLRYGGAPRAHHGDALNEKYKGCPWDYNVFSHAAAAPNGPIVMKWLLENGCPWSTITFYEAVRHGNLNNIKWLHDHGCPWDESAFDASLRHTSRVIAQWLRRHGCPGSRRESKKKHS